MRVAEHEAHQSPGGAALSDLERPPEELTTLDAARPGIRGREPNPAGGRIDYRADRHHRRRRGEARESVRARRAPNQHLAAHRRRMTVLANVGTAGAGAPAAAAPVDRAHTRHTPPTAQILDRRPDLTARSPRDGRPLSGCSSTLQPDERLSHRGPGRRLKAVFPPAAAEGGQGRKGADPRKGDVR